MNVRKEIEMDKIKNLLEGADTAFVFTNKGQYVNGEAMTLLMIFSEMVHTLKKNGTPKMFLQAAFEIGLEDMEEINEMAENLTDGEFERKAKEADKSLGMLLELLKGIK